MPKKLNIQSLYQNLENVKLLIKVVHERLLTEHLQVARNPLTKFNQT